MNLQFLGNAPRSLERITLRVAAAAGELTSFVVDPMATGLPLWRPDDFNLFAKLLRVSARKFLSINIRWLTARLISTRSPMTATCPWTPTPVWRLGGLRKTVGPAKSRACLIRRLACLRFISTYALSVFAIVWTAFCTSCLHQHQSSCHWCSYESGTVAMLFLSLSRTRIDSVCGHFARLLGDMPSDESAHRLAVGLILVGGRATSAEGICN